jgi:amino acid transporter
MIISLIFVLGGGPSNGKYNEYWGARYWYDPGAFKNGFKGFCSVFVTAAFAFSGTELVGLAAAETKNPLKSLPGAIRQVFWRITLFYILGLTFVGLLVDSNNPDLLGESGANASPFVIIGRDGGLKGFDSFMNVVILVSVISIGVSGVYGGSRTLTALAEQGYAPKIFTYMDRSGRPTASVIFILVWGGLAYMNLASTGETVFDWFVALSGLAALFTWGSICLSHIRFRKAWAYHGHTVDEIPFKAAGGVYGSWLGLFIIFVVLIAQVCFNPFSKLISHKLMLNSSTLLSPLSANALVPPRNSSARTLLSSSSCSSGSAVTSGSVPVGSGPPRWTLTLAVVSLTGISSTVSARR